jgi:hypothetical protein
MIIRNNEGLWRVCAEQFILTVDASGGVVSLILATKPGGVSQHLAKTCWMAEYHIPPILMYPSRKKSETQLYVVGEKSSYYRSDGFRHQYRKGSLVNAYPQNE